MTHVEATAKQLFEEGRIQNIAVRAGIKDRTLIDYYQSTTQPLNEHTLFDMASVTKILCTTQLALIAIDRGLLRLDTSLSEFFDYDGPLTVKHLLTHTIGSGHLNLTKKGATYETVAAEILSSPHELPIGSDVLYSCPAFILLGQISEKVFGDRLDVLFGRYVCAPLGMERTSFCPAERENIVNANQTEQELGLVNDYNCRYLGRVAGNAGSFSCTSDLERFCRMHILGNGAPLYSEATLNLATQDHTPGMSAARGLGYLYVDKRYPQTGKLFPVGSFGHCGHTGQLVFMNASLGLYAIILTDATKCNTAKYGHSQYDLVKNMREILCNAIKADLGM